MTPIKPQPARTAGRCACGRPAVRRKQNTPVCEVCDAREHASRALRRNPGTGRRSSPLAP